MPCHFDGKGTLRWTLQQILVKYEQISAELPGRDSTDAAGFGIRLQAVEADAVIHCMAMTTVDRC